ncbi:MAG TPA: lipopolysaccharide biosynthesis protein [Gemmatimonadaceae bacterium]|nr:lipopolysaccharide biosynthesis protein [Gemmatimonadaceae bacterium]
MIQDASEGVATPAVRRGRTDRTLANWLWMTGSAAAQGALSIAVLAVLARLLSPRDFGLASASMLVIKLSMIFSQVGVGPAIVQHPALRPAHVQTGTVCSVLFGVLLLGLLWASAPLIAVGLHAPALAPVVRALAWSLPIQSGSIVAESLLRRDLEFRTIAAIRVASYAIGYGVVGIALAGLGLGVWALVWAQLVQTAAYTAGVNVRRPHSWRPAVRRRELRELLTFGGGLTLARIGNYAAVNGDYMVVVKWLGVVSLGLYERAYQLMAMPATLIGQVMDDVLFPAMAQIQDERSRVGAAYRRAVAAVAVATLPVSTLVIVLAPELVLVLLGPKWTAATRPLQILAAGTLFRTSYKVSDSLTRALGAVYARAWRQWIYAGLVIGGGALGQPWGISGVATGVLFALLVNFLLMAHLSTRLLGLSWVGFFRAHLAGVKLAALCGGITALVAAAARPWLPPIGVLVAAVVVLVPAGVPLLLRAPAWLLGDDERWLVRRLADFVGRRVPRLRSIVRPAS